MNVNILTVEKTERAILRILLLTAVALTVFGLFACEGPLYAVKGLWEIFTTSDVLITDYLEIGGLGGGLLNSGLAMLFSIFLVKISGAAFDGKTIGCCFIVAGFALFGKNVLTMAVIILGIYLYSRFKNEPFKNHIHVGLFVTCLGPLVTHAALNLPVDILAVRLLFAVFMGLLIGFVVPQVAVLTSKLHGGMLIFNVGFASGMVSTVIVAVLKSFGWEFSTVLIWSSGNDMLLGVFLSVMFLALIAAGFVFNGFSFNGLGAIRRHTGQSPCDYVTLEGLAPTLINMGILGFMFTGYILAVGGPLNGPTIGGILTIVGFGAFGMNYYNVLWCTLGIFMMSFVSTWSLSDPGILLAALFCPCICPIAGKHGPFWGVVSGMLHVCVVCGTAVNFGWLNLYNNGFAAGIVCIFLLPIIDNINSRKAA